MEAMTDKGTLLCAMLGDAAKYSKLISVTATPATGAAGGTLEYTVLDSESKQYLPDRIDLPALDFIYNYSEDNFETASTACTGDTEKFLIVYQDGSGDAIEGVAQTWNNGAARGAIMEATLHIVPSKITFMTKAQVDAVYEVPSF